VLLSAIAFPHGGDERLRDAARQEHLLAVRSAKQSFWRREVRVFSRRQRDVAPVLAEPTDVGAKPGDMLSEPKVPWYKRELGPQKNKKNKKDEKVKNANREAVAAEAPQRVSEPKVPWYKREVGRKKRVQPVDVEAVREEQPADEPGVVERILMATEHMPSSEDSDGADTTEATSSAADPWSAFFGDAVVTVDTPADDLTDDAPGQDEPAAETADAESQASEPKVPWYKREIGSKKKDAKKARVEDEPVAVAPKVPWYRRELGPRKNDKNAEKAAVVAEAPQHEDEPVAVEPKVPWYKRELGPKKKDKKNKNAEKAAVVAEAPEREDERAPEPKVPWYKREIGRKKTVPPVEAEAVREEQHDDEPTAVERILGATERPVPTNDEPGAPDAAEPRAPVAGDAWTAFFDTSAAVAEQEPTPATADTIENSPQGDGEQTHLVADTEPAEPKVPWYKRELGSKKNKDQKRDKKADKAEKTARVDERRRSEPNVPWYKREIGRKKSAPSRSREQQRRHARRGGGRKQRIVGLKVGGSQLAAARVVNNGSAELVQLARMDLQRGVVVGGELRDPEALTTALKKFFRDNKLPRQGVRLGIGSNRIGVRVFDIAGVEDRGLLDNAVRFKAQEFLPIPIEQAVLDYHVVGESSDEDGKTVHRVLVAFAYRELVDRYLDACKRAGIRLSGIDLEAFALLRAMGAPTPADSAPRDAAVIAVAIGHDRSTLAVSDGQICEFTRILEWGGFQLDVAVSRVLGVTPSEAEAVKLQVDLASDSRVIGDLTPERTTEVRDAVKRQIELLARELVSSLQFYQSQPGSLGVGEIVITGGTAQLPGLAAELQRLIGVQVRVGDPYARVKVGRRVKAEAQLPSLAVAIGLGIED
jgi:type IV pilus assembly protein PilM